jgi:hypothetical protein
VAGVLGAGVSEGVVVEEDALGDGETLGVVLSEGVLDGVVEGVLVGVGLGDGC